MADPGFGGGSKRTTSSSTRPRSSSASPGFGGGGGGTKAAKAEGKSLKNQGMTAVGRALQLLDQGRRGVVAVVKELDDAVPGFTQSDRDQANGFKLSDIAKNYNARIGAGDMVDTGNKWGNRALGLAGDIVLDPLSYVTLGVGSATKAGAKGGLSVVGKRGRAGASELVRTIAKSGDDELANAVASRGIRGSANALTKEQAVQFGIRQGPTFGVGKAKVAVPGGDALARTLSNALAPATTRVNKLPLHGIGNSVKGLTPLQRNQARDADRTRRWVAKGTQQTALREMGKLAERYPSMSDPADLAIFRDAMEGIGTHPAAAEGRAILDKVWGDAGKALGRDLPSWDDYLPHMLSPDSKKLREAQGIKSPPKPGGKPGAMKERGFKKGDPFMGETLVDGSITERNRIFAAKTGGNVKYFEDNPVLLMKQYIDDITTMVSRSQDSFATAAGAVDAPLVEQSVKGAKKAAKEARKIDKQLAKAADELDQTRAKIKNQSEQLDITDAAARQAVDDANRSGARMAVPEAAAPGKLAGLPDLKSKRAALAAAQGRDNRIATDELLDLTGAKATGKMTQGEREFLLPDGWTGPERNIGAHVDANIQYEDALARQAAAKADVAEKLRPEVSRQARKFDHARGTRDPEDLMDAARDNTQSLDALRVIGYKANQEELALRETTDRLYNEAARLRAEGDHELAEIAVLEGRAKQLQADMPDIDAKLQKYLAKAGSTEMVRDLDAMIRQGFVQLNDGRWAEPWVAEAAAAIERAVTPANVGRLIKEFDRHSGFWRATALLSPGFHMRNGFGAMFNNSLADMDWGRYAQYRTAKNQFNKGGLDAITDPQVRAAVESGMRNGQWEGADISDVTKIAGMKEGGTIIGRNNKAFQFNFKVGGKVEAYARMPLYIDTFIKTGGDEMASMDRVMKYHFDYDDLSKMEREVGRRAFGFYTWSRNNLPLMMAEMADKPGVFNRYTHLKRNMELGEETDENKPSYFNKALAIGLPFKFKGNRIYSFPDMPFISAGSIMGTSELATGLNPFIKTPIETFTNTKFFEQRNFSATLKSTPAVWKPILEVLVHTGKVPGLPKVHRGADGSLMMDEREANKIESLMPLLGRMRRLAPSEKKYQDRVLTSWLSFVGGISMRTLDDATVGGEMARRKTASSAKASREATLKGGTKLDEFKAAERKAKAIKMAQEGRRG